MFALLLAWIFGAVYTVCCIGCIFEGARMLLKGNSLTDKTVGLLVLLLGIVGLNLLF
jgi:hypothetical protein